MAFGTEYGLIFFDTSRVVHLENRSTGLPFCERPGGRLCWMATATVDVPNGCRRCVTAATRGGAS